MTLVGIAACAAAAEVHVGAARRHGLPNDDTTGHVWDEDLREYNNPLPRWWMWLFYITIVFGSPTWCCIRAWAAFAGYARLELAQVSTSRARSAETTLWTALCERYASAGPGRGSCATRRRGASASGCSSTTARSATAPTRGGSKGSPT